MSEAAGSYGARPHGKALDFKATGKTIGDVVADMGTDDLVTWYRAQLDEEERVIRAAADDYFYADGHGNAVNAWFDRWAPDQPERMLAEVDAKRRIVGEHEPHEQRPWECRTCAGPHGDDGYTRPCPTVRLLALPLAGQPGYREEWAPDTP